MLNRRLVNLLVATITACILLGLIWLLANVADIIADMLETEISAVFGVLIPVVIIGISFVLIRDKN